MAWVSDYYGTTGTNRGWSYSTLNGGFVRVNYGPSELAVLKYTSTNYEYKTNKTYILRTDVKNFYDTMGRLNVSMPFGTSTAFTASSIKISSSYSPGYGYTNNTTTSPGRNIPLSSDADTTIIYYSSVSTSNNSINRASYNETYASFYQSYIKSFDLIELDWYIQGYSIATSSNITSDKKYEGWRYLPNDKSFKFQKAYTSTGDWRLPAESLWKQTSASVWESNAYTKTNYIAKYVSYENFNLQIEFENPLSVASAFVNIYLTENKLPYSMYNVNDLAGLTSFSQSLAGGQYVGKILNTGTYSFYNLTGGKFLNFVANYEGTSAYNMSLSNIQIEGGYSEPDNNIQLPFTTTEQFYSPTPLSVIGVSPDVGYSLYTVGSQTQHLTDGISGPVFNGATGSISGDFNGFFSPIYGTVTNLNLVNSKMGNGYFKSGIWENGVWNNGWRVDENDNDFDYVIYAFQLSTENKRWRIQISGSTYSAAKFEIGDKVSIGNIVSIDINEKRKLLKNYFTVVNKSLTDIIVEVDNNFPIRRIEKDSENHKIKVTKNVWLNGAFLNGMFQGVWNNGLFKGYPIITEMYNTHWVDGKFDGGHFYSEEIQYTFVDTYYLDGYVGLSCSSIDNALLPGDLIEIDKDDKTINPQYDGYWSVTKLSSPGIVKTNIPWGANSTLEGGLVKRRTKTGLIQNFKFKDNNVAQYDLKSIKGTSQSYTYDSNTVLEKIWKFNSWIDVNYTTYSSTNIGRNKTKFGEDPKSYSDFAGGTKLGQGEYSESNLYGYTTEDVLSSESSFRDIDSKVNRYYSLGTKYEIFEDYLGDFSNFDSPFDSASGSNIGLKNFYNDGWTFSYSGSFAYNNGSFVFDDNAYVEERVGFIGLTGSDLRVGDEIYVSQYSGATYLSYNGTSSITKIIKANAGTSSPFPYIPNYRDYYIHVTNKIFEGTTGTESGTIRYTKRAPIGYTISRTVDSTIRIEQPNEYSQFMTLKNSNITIPKRRYSILEFDLIDHDNITATNSFAKYDPINLFNIAKIPNSNDTGYTTIDAFPKVPQIDSRYLGRKNKTYYFNRLNSNIGIYSIGGITFGSPGIVFNLGGSFVELDNIKFYEVDMIPFFQYTTEDYVNKSVQVPYIGTAPFIDYSDNNFSFIENIIIGFDGILTNSFNNISSSVIFNTINNENIYYGHEYTQVSFPSKFSEF